MTDMATALTQHLLADAAITAIIGDRVFPQESDAEASSPRIMYFRVSSGAADGLTTDAPTEYFRSLWQLDLRARSKDDLTALETAVKGWMDHQIMQVWSGVTVLASFLVDERDVPFDQAANLHGVQHDYRIEFQTGD
ncbi:hypothetical protein [Microcystis phage Mae-JY04]|uniref:tail completion protein gp17 n=1 Tax=Blastomonas sp. TaxID=1909299 RepID=UPI002584B516|nr:hypothetical protein [Blastomonas sp.]